MSIIHTPHLKPRLLKKGITGLGVTIYSHLYFSAFHFQKKKMPHKRTSQASLSKTIVLRKEKRSLPWLAKALLEAVRATRVIIHFFGSRAQSKARETNPAPCPRRSWQQTLSPGDENICCRPVFRAGSQGSPRLGSTVPCWARPQSPEFPEPSAPALHAAAALSSWDRCGLSTQPH